MSGNESGPTMESAMNQLEAALGHEVTGVNLNLAEGKVEVLLGSKGADVDIEDVGADDDTEGVDVEAMSWNDMVALASKLGLYETGDDSESLEAKLREADLEEVGETVTEGDDGGDVVTIEGLAEKVSEGDLEMDEAKDKAQSEGLEVADLFIAVNGDCQSRRDCEHGARSEGADFCWQCHNDLVPPKEGYKGLEEAQVEAVPTLVEGGSADSLEEAADVMA